MWENAILKKILNTRKLLPMSESLSSMNVEVLEAIKSGSVTTMALTEGFVEEQLIVGTSAGVLIIVQAREVLYF